MPPEQGKKPATTQNTNALELKLTTEKETYIVGEPVYVSAYLKNTSKKGINVFRFLEPGEGALELEIIKNDEKRTSFIPLEEADHDKTSKITLKPNQEIGEAFPVFFGGKGWSFPKNGIYKLRATYKTKQAEGIYISTTSNTLIIKVTNERNPQVDHLVSGSKSSYQSGLFMTWLSGDHLTNGKEILNSILKSKQETDLNNYINLAFGKSLSEPFMDYRNKKPREANYKTARSYLDQVDANRLPKYLQIQYHLASAKCNYNNVVKNKEKTLEHLTQIEFIISNDIAYTNLNSRIKEMKARVQ